MGNSKWTMNPESGKDYAGISKQAHEASHRASTLSHHAYEDDLGVGYGSHADAYRAHQKAEKLHRAARDKPKKQAEFDIINVQEICMTLLALIT